MKTDFVFSECTFSNLLLPDTGVLRTHVESVMLKEVQRAYDVRVFGQFTSRRLEDMAIQYFKRLLRSGTLRGVRDFGSYWYDDPIAKSNGEFDCVLSREGSLDFYECKYFDRPMMLTECENEERQVRAIPGASVGAIGFICSGGFDFKSKAYELVAGDDLYRAGA